MELALPPRPPLGRVSENRKAERGQNQEAGLQQGPKAWAPSGPRCASTNQLRRDIGSSPLCVPAALSPPALLSFLRDQAHSLLTDPCLLHALLGWALDQIQK